jgi:hypothetical protein
MKLFFYLLMMSFVYPVIIITGKVTDENNEPIIYANVYLKDTFDGTSSDENGEFQFETYESGLQTLVVSYVGYETYEQEYNIDASSTFEIVLEELITQANEVVITAGSFGASDDEKVIVLDPVDIVSVASSRGEISGALEALPGTQPQADKEGIYVRGGDASEAKQIIDGMLVQNPYFSDVPDIPQRGRFEPFDFQGTAFSQGGYSAQYGQALSSIVDLQTWSRFGEFNAHILGVTPIGFRYGRGYANDSTSCSLDFNYGNQELLQDFNNNGILADFIKNRTSFSEPPEGTGIRTSYSKKLTNGIYKFLGRYTDYSLGTNDSDVGANFSLSNDVLYLLTTYKGSVNDKLDVQLGLSYSDNHSDATIGIELEEDAQLVYGISNVDLLAYSNDDLLQFRSVLSRKIFSKSRFKYGFHIFDQSSAFYNYVFKEETNPETQGVFQSIDFTKTGPVVFEEFLVTGFLELDLRLSKKFAINTGVRYEDSKLINRENISPRFSMAYKISKNTQTSYAYGKYYQTPELGFDQWYRRNNIDFNYIDIENLKFENSEHHILNYEWNKKGKMLRLEVFEKTYNNLITLHPIECDNNVCPNTISNNGKGYSKGFEMFWRYDQKDNEGVGQDIFMTYSYLDSKRSFKEYLDTIRPSFASEHKVTFSYNNTFNINETENRLSASLALTGTSGFPYYDPFDKVQYTSTPYFSLDIGGSYLPDMKDKGFLVLFFNISNPLGYRNSFGYNYIAEDYSKLDEPKENLPASMRTIFIGCFMIFNIKK